MVFVMIEIYEQYGRDQIISVPYHIVRITCITSFLAIDSEYVGGNEFTSPVRSENSMKFSEQLISNNEYNRI